MYQQIKGVLEGLKVHTIEQYDKAMLDKLQGLVIDGEEIPVIYISPEQEERDSKLPCITVHRAGAYPDQYRWQNEVVYDNEIYDEEGKLVQLDERERPHPYSIYYGVRANYQYQEDGMIMNTHIHKCIPRGSTVTIDGYVFDMEFVSYKNPSATYRDFGESKAKDRREFSEQYLYKIQGALDFSMRETKKVVTEGVSHSVHQMKEE